MRFILIYKRIFLVLYAINFVLIFSHGSGGEDFEDWKGYQVFITLLVFGLNLYTHENFRKNTIRRDQIEIEEFLTQFRISMNFWAALWIGTLFAPFSPVYLVFWSPLLEITSGNLLPKYTLSVICLILFIIEWFYFSKVFKLKKRIPEYPAVSERAKIFFLVALGLIFLLAGLTMFIAASPDYAEATLATAVSELIAFICFLRLNTLLKNTKHMLQKFGMALSAGFGMAAFVAHLDIMGIL